MIVACAADKKDGYFRQLEAKVLASGHTFIYRHMPAFTWAEMIRWEHAVASCYPDDHICFVDAWDFIMQGSGAELAALAHPLLFHSESVCWPEPHRADQFPEVDTKFRYVNGTGPLGLGSWIFRAIDFGKELFPIRGEESSIFADNDQRFWTDVYLSGLGSALDWKCRLSVSLNSLTRDEFELRDGRLWVKETGTSPVFVHANGNSRTMYADVIEELICKH